MALFLPDETNDQVIVRYAAGLHAASMRGVTRPTAMGIAGWTAVNRRAECAPALRSCVVVPLVESDALVAVLGIYSTNAAAFTEDHLRLLEVLGSRLAAALVDAAIADEDSQQQVPVVRPRPLKLVQTS